MRTVDVGIAILSMHSIREMCATADVGISLQHFSQVFRGYSELDAKFEVDPKVNDAAASNGDKAGEPSAKKARR